MPAKRAAAESHDLWFVNWKIWMDARQLLAVALEPLGLSAREFWLLSVVRAAPQPQNELAALLGLDPSTVVTILDRLEQRGWIERRRHPRDRRVHPIGLTRAGEELHQAALPLAQRAEAEQMRRLSPAEQRRLLELLRKLVHA